MFYVSTHVQFCYLPPWLLRMDALADKVHSMAQASAGGFTGAPKKRARKAKFFTLHLATDIYLFYGVI